MDTLAVIEHLDVLEDRRSSRLAADEHAAIDKFELQRCEEALRHGVVPAVALSGHTRDHAKFGQSTPVRYRRVRLALVAVMNPGLGVGPYISHRDRKVPGDNRYIAVDLRPPA